MCMVLTVSTSGHRRTKSTETSFERVLVDWSAYPGSCWTRGSRAAVVAPKDTMDLTGLLPALLADPAAARAVELVRSGGEVDIVGPAGVRPPLLPAQRHGREADRGVPPARDRVAARGEPLVRQRLPRRQDRDR